MKNEQLIAARKQSGKTQEQVATNVGVSTRMYQTYESGTRTPNSVTGNKIARALGTTSEKLWGYGDSKEL